MADFTKTISNSINCFSLEPATNWNEFNWGTGFWGYGSNTIPLDVVKNLDNSFTVDDYYERSYEKLFSESLSMDSDITEETLQDGNGYYYVFPRPTIDSNDRNNGMFTEVSNGSTSWTEDTDSDTSWTEDT